MSKLNKPKKVVDLWTDKASQTIPKFQHMTNSDARAAYCDWILNTFEWDKNIDFYYHWVKNASVMDMPNSKIQSMSHKAIASGLIKKSYMLEAASKLEEKQNSC